MTFQISEVHHQYLKSVALMNTVLPRDNPNRPAGPAYVQHKPEDPAVSVEQWYAQQNHPFAFDTIFDKSGHFKPLQIKDNVDWLETDIDLLRRHLTSLLQQAYDLVDISLLQGHNGSFNSHNIESHVAVVEARATFLLDQLDTLYQPVRDSKSSIKLYGETINLDEERRVLLIASYLHDLGNFYSRTAHPLISVRMANDLLGSVLGKLPLSMQRKIRFAIKFHDEKIATYVLGHINNLSDDESRAEFVKKYGIAPLLLLAADKADAVARRRAPLSDNAAAESVMADKHSILAAMVRAAGDHHLYGNELLIRRMIISPTLDSLDVAVVEQFRRPTRPRSGQGVDKTNGALLLPKHYIENHDDRGIPHFLTWMIDYISMHEDRLILETAAVFAAHSRLQWFEIRIYEHDDRFPGYMDNGQFRPQGLSATLRLSRQSFRQDIKDIHEALSGQSNDHQPSSFVDQFVENGREWMKNHKDSPFYFRLRRKQDSDDLMVINHCQFRRDNLDARYASQLFAKKEERLQ